MIQRYDLSLNSPAAHQRRPENRRDDDWVRALLHRGIGQRGQVELQAAGRGSVDQVAGQLTGQARCGRSETGQHAQECGSREQALAPALIPQTPYADKGAEESLEEAATYVRDRDGYGACSIVQRGG